MLKRVLKEGKAAEPSAAAQKSTIVTRQLEALRLPLENLIALTSNNYLFNYF